MDARERRKGAGDGDVHAVRQEAQQLGQTVSTAVKQSFATSVTQIYVYAFWLSIIALVAIAFWLPEIPLSKSSRTEAPLAVE